MFTIKEEIANAITHGIGVLLSIPALVFLIIFAANYGSAWDIVSFTIFGVSMLLLYLSSTLLHSITHKKTKDILEIIDHSAIYVLIAGTYTPFACTAERHTRLYPVGYRMVTCPRRNRF